MVHIIQKQNVLVLSVRDHSVIPSLRLSECDAHGGGRGVEKPVLPSGISACFLVATLKYSVWCVPVR